MVKYIECGRPAVFSPEYPVRPTRADDLFFILEVHASFTRAYPPAGRLVDLQALEAGFQLTYLHLDLTTPSYFVIEEAASGKRAGYLLINPSDLVAGARTFYVYDVAIAPEFSGRGLSRFLQAAAESVAAVEGGFVYGDGSLESPALASWHAQMGYSVDTIRFGLPCSETPKFQSP